MLSRNAKWIWTTEKPKKNEFALFKESFTYSGGRACFSVCAEMEYALYVNGELADFGQYAGYPFEKYYNEADITHLLKSGENTLSLTVRYEGLDSITHIDDGAGVIFSLSVEDSYILESGESTLSGYDNRYLQNVEWLITWQLGYTCTMRMPEGEAELHPSVLVQKTDNIKPRPIKKPEIIGFCEAKPIKSGSRIFDLGREEAGYLKLKVKAKAPSKFKVTYGEHLDDGRPRYLIDGRDFSLDFEMNKGEYEFLNLFIRVAGRYLEVIGGEDIEILSIGLLTTLYPFKEKGHNFKGLDKEIYETCIRTLRLCVNQHYEDCPWREQALYVFDSKNQMLCGYEVFEGYDFQRANIAFMSKGIIPDGLMEMTYPAIKTDAIPFFSLMYFVQVEEYIRHSGDKTILDEIMDMLVYLMGKFEERIDETGLIPNFPKPYWNFYEWKNGSDGRDTEKYHLLLNCFFVYAYERYKKLREYAGRGEAKCDTDKVKEAIVKSFYYPEKGLFSLFKDKELYSQLGNALPILIGLGDERTADALIDNKDLIPATLSMLPFIYDAILERGGRESFIIEDIREKYGYMLSRGATTFWETLDGGDAFDKAGSLCHGWSAIPIIYYNHPKLKDLW